MIVRGRVVVVGVDGSPPSAGALRWAAEAAQLRGTRLLVATVHDGRLPRALRRSTDPSSAHRVDMDDAQAVDVHCAAMQHRLISRLPEPLTARTTSVVLRGDPVRTLTELVGTEALLVLGTRGRATVSTLFRPSVARACSAHTPSRVVVVPTPWRAPGTTGVTGPVVVGVDRFPAQRRAVRLAVEEARLRGAPLLAVHVVSPGYLSGTSAHRSESAPDLCVLDPLDSVAAQLDAIVRLEAAQYGVAATAVASTGRTAAELLRWAESAQLLVIGTRGTGGLGAALVGSVSAEVLRTSRCPTAVVASE